MAPALADAGFGSATQGLEGPAPCSPAACSRGKLTGWLLKRKSGGARSRLFRSANRRYFTLDFEGRLFYYAHTEGNKVATLPLAFRQLVSVEPLAAVLQDAAADEQETLAHGLPEPHPKGPAASSFRVPKISFGALKRPAAEHHGFLLRTTDKDMELLCSSRAEAEEWVQGLRGAIALGAEGCSEGGLANPEEPLKVELSTSAGSSPEAPLSPRSQDEDSIPELLVPRSTPEASPQLEQATPRIVLAFGESHAAAAERESERGQKPKSRGLGKLLPRRMGRHRLQSADKGQGEPGRVTEMDFEAKLLHDAAEGAWDEKRDDTVTTEVAEASEVSKRYADKGSGLSLKERLDQMDFSDEEET